ncbi:unnamed protein product [Closterium sp. NIES-65]|nr:unnamed protein product [Closterium sp. NIES-65]
MNQTSSDPSKSPAADAAVTIASPGQASPSGACDKEHAPAAPSAPSAPADASPLALTTAQLQQGDAEGALANVTQIETLINKRFEVLLVADEAGFEAADRFQLYQSKSVLTSRSYKLAVADVAASKRARMSYTRTVRGNGLDNGEIGNKGAGQGSCQNRAFKGTCFRCGQLGHMANACPMGGRGGQGPTPVV